MTLDRKNGERLALARDALGIVLTGLALGVAFNYLEMSSRPPRGLPWIASTQSLDNADSLAAAAGVPAGTTPLMVSAVPAPTDPVRHSGSSHQPAYPSIKSTHGSPSATPTAAAPARPTVTTDHREVSPPPALTAGLPMIPDTGRPLSVELPTVAKFIEADAALVLDARDRQEFADGHIPGAINVPYDEAVRDPAHLEKLDSGGRPFIVYCSGGACEASLMLAQMMVRDFDMRRVLVYEAGYPEWVAAGKPVARESQ